MIGIILFIISTGIFIRGVLYYLASVAPMSSKFKVFSISKNENPLEYTEENKLASKAYMTIGGIVIFLNLILILTYYQLLSKYYIMNIIAIFLIDLFTNILVNVKIQINKYDKIQNSKNKKEEN